MKAFCIGVLLLLVGCVSSMPEGRVAPGYPKFIAGTYMKGHNVTEPRPQASKFFKADEAGIIILENGAGFYLRARRIGGPARPLYIQVEYENPLDKAAPFVNDMEFPAEETHAVFSSPEFVWGLRIYADYEIKVSFYASKEDLSKPLDVLVQKIRCYVDTTTRDIQVFDGLKSGAPG